MTGITCLLSPRGVFQFNCKDGFVSWVWGSSQYQLENVHPSYCQLLVLLTSQPVVIFRAILAVPIPSPLMTVGAWGRKPSILIYSPKTQTSPSPGPGWCWGMYPPFLTTPLALPWLLSYSHNSKGVPTLKGWGLSSESAIKFPLYLGLPCPFNLAV